MTKILLRGGNAESMHTLSAQLAQDLNRAGLDTDLQVGSPVTQTDDQITRGDPITLTAIALTAVGAGGALTALLSKDGFLSALARVLEKYVEGRKAEVLIETGDGKKMQINGPVGEIKAILQQIRDA